MTPLDHLLKYRDTLVQHRRHLAHIAAEDDGLNHAERLQKVQGEIEAIDRAIADEREMLSGSA